MGQALNAVDAFAVTLANTVIRHRWVTIALSVLVSVAIFLPASTLQFATNYRVFFSKENPELTAFEDFQATYTKNDNFFFVLEPAGGDVFTNKVMQAVARITEEGWKIPYAIRVDSLTNFQHTYAIADDLIVEDLIGDAATITPDQLEERRQIALAEPLLRDQLVTRDSKVTGINIVLQYPEKTVEEIPEAVAAVRALRAEIEAEFPDIKVSLTGVSMLNNAFQEAGLTDLSTLIPTMYLVLLLVMALTIRSILATLATLAVILFSSMAGMGFAGAVGINLTPISAAAPTIIMTLAIADSVHILLTMRSAMRRGMSRNEALVEAIRVNFLAVMITSLTTIVGFLALNFSDAPPFWHLGNMTAVGIFWAFVLSVTLLPALMSLLPYKVRSSQPETQEGATVMGRLADFVIANHRSVGATMAALCVAAIAMMPLTEFNDEWTKYFDERIEFRVDSDRAQEHFGLYPIEYSVEAAEPGGISEPEFLERLEAFADFLRTQPGVTHVYALTDIMKRLNKNLHADDPDFYRIPGDRELSAQYLLLYELSLPYGLDLNDRVNIDKSATRVTVTLGGITTADTKRFLADVDAWMAENFPDHMVAKATSTQVMFTYITDRNVNSMMRGTTLAIIAIALIMVVALRSVRLGMLSLIPNGLPILTTFGVWALLVGQVGLSVSIIAAISLGIIVDDTVHFLTKYVRARTEHRLSPPDSIRYAFNTVGLALVVNTVVLTIGFLVLTTSAFKPNLEQGLLTVIAIVFALILDFLLLPALLLLIDRKQEEPTQAKGEDNAQPSLA